MRRLGRRHSVIARVCATITIGVARVHQIGWRLAPLSAPVSCGLRHGTPLARVPLSTRARLVGARPRPALAPGYRRGLATFWRQARPGQRVAENEVGDRWMAQRGPRGRQLNPRTTTTQIALPPTDRRRHGSFDLIHSARAIGCVRVFGCRNSATHGRGRAHTQIARARSTHARAPTHTCTHAHKHAHKHMQTHPPTRGATAAAVHRSLTGSHLNRAGSASILDPAMVKSRSRPP